jgi:hypothetical protein
MDVLAGRCYFAARPPTAESLPLLTITSTPWSQPSM